MQVSSKPFWMTSRGTMYSITGWESASQHRFKEYGQQRSWKRVPAHPLTMDGFIDVTETEQLPDGW